MQKKIYLLVFFIIVFLLILWGVESHNPFILFIDERMVSLAESIRFPFLDGLMVSVTNIGGVLGSTVIFIIFGFALFVKKARVSLYLLISTLFLSGLFSIIIKNTVERIRPAGYLITETGFSFPSNHALFATAFLIASLVFIAPVIRNITGKTIFLVIAWILFPLIALSRIYLSVHFASDVLGSVFLAMICYLLSSLIVPKIPLLKERNNAIN